LRLLLDEMLSRSIAEGLRRRGHDAIALTENPGWVSLGDAEVLELARSERRALVTNNVADFRALHLLAIQSGATGHFGIIFLSSQRRRRKADSGLIIKALEQTLADHAQDDALANSEAWI
jgi:predicted nuclease of predicted toxin-antitoxin system